MSLIEVARLTPAQRSELTAYGREWDRVRRSTTPVDRAEAEEGVARAYAAVGLPAPRRVVWAGSPVDAARQWIEGCSTAGENVRHIVVDTARRRAEAAVDRAVGLAARTALLDEPRLSRPQPFGLSIEEAVLTACERVRLPLRSRLRSLFTLGSLRSLHGFAPSSFGFQASAILGTLQFLHDACNLQSHTRALTGLWQVARNATWMIPHEDVCWLSDRPSRLEVDANSRLHCADGPALTFRDGWTIHAWKGVIVPSWMIERRDLVTVRTIGNAVDPQVRRCMIDILTPARFVADGGACRVSQDETGVLWRQRWRWEAWAAVEVVNGSPEPDGTHRHYFLQVPATVRTAREGVAWTYGLPEQRYRPVSRT